jgi:glycosyltransferase involved in cell wall biosynthesis
MQALKSPEISVILPVYNAESYLRAAIESVLIQKGCDFELLIGDNASTDRSVEIARSFSDPRIRLFINEQNAGIFGNLNLLVSRARAPILKILCADDALLPGGLKSQLDFLRAHPEAGMAHCLQVGDLGSWNSGNLRFQKELPVFIPARLTPLVFATFGNIPGNLSKVIVRREALDKAGLFDQELPYAGDFDMWYRVASRGGIAIQKEEAVFVRAHPEQNSNLLNTRNELACQQQAIYDRILREVAQGDRALLRWHLTVWVVTQQVPRAFRCWRRGDKRAFKFLFERKTYAYSGWLALFVCFVTAFRRMGADLSTRILFRRIMARTCASSIRNS